MKKVFKAYFKLRKGWIITLYGLLLLAGLASMVNDNVQWHKWEAAVTKNTNAKEYQKFRSYYKNNPDLDVYGTVTPESHIKYLNSVPINSVFFKEDRVTGKMIYQSSPAEYETYRDNLLAYYPKKDNYFYDRIIFRNLPSETNEHTNVQINLVALMSETILLTFVVAFALAVVLDQSKHITAFIGSRMGGTTTLHFAQFIYWVGIPLIIASILSLITHLTRQFFIPSQYVKIPWEKVLELSGEALSVALIAAIGVSLVDALVGKPVYKIVTGVLAVPALAIAMSNLRQLITCRAISDIMVKIPLFIYMFVFAAIVIPIVLVLQKSQSLEQDSFYIKLKALRLPFYIGIVIVTIIDFFLPFFMMGRVLDSPLTVVINSVMMVGLLAVFAKLVLDKDIRNFLKK
jgi:hypothetical protein